MLLLVSSQIVPVGLGEKMTAGEPEFKAGKVLCGGDPTLGLEVKHGLVSHRRAKDFLN